MPKNTFISLIAALGYGIPGGIATLLLAWSLLQNLYIQQPDEFFDVRGYSLLVGVILCFTIPFFVCIGFLTPLAAIDKTKIEISSAKALLIRYTPFIAIPAGSFLLFLFIIDFEEANARYFLMTLLFTVAGISFSALWGFVHRLKHRS